jgi:hypothetical protein
VIDVADLDTGEQRVLADGALFEAEVVGQDLDLLGAGDLGQGVLGDPLAGHEDAVLEQEDGNVVGGAGQATGLVAEVGGVGVLEAVAGGDEQVLPQGSSFAYVGWAT